MPVIEITLQPGRRVYAESGSLGWMPDGITMQTVVQGSPWAMLGRAVAGMTPLVTQFAAESAEGVVAFTLRVPGESLPIDGAREREYILQGGAFLAAQESVNVGPFFNQDLGAAIFGGEGFILQKLRGHGTVFVKIDGEVAQYELQPAQVLLVNPGYVALFDASVGFSIRRVPGIANVLFSQGLFLTELRGSGMVWLQTMPFGKLAGSIAARIAESSAKASLGGLGAVGAVRSVEAGLGGIIGGGIGAIIENMGDP